MARLPIRSCGVVLASTCGLGATLRQSARMMVSPWFLLLSAICMISAGPMLHIRAQVTPAQDGDAGSAIINELNKDIRAINEDLQSLTANIEIKPTTKSGTASAGCIIPSPFGCICHASANYQVNLDSCKVGTIAVSAFNKTSELKPSESGYTISFVASMSISGASFSGTVHGSADACGISPSGSGDASTSASDSGSINFQASLTPGSNGCASVSITSASVRIGTLKLSNTVVNLDILGIKIDIGSIVDAINSLAGPLETQLLNALTSALSPALPGIATKVIRNDGSCIKYPGTTPSGSQSHGSSISLLEIGGIAVGGLFAVVIAAFLVQRIRKLDTRSAANQEMPQSGAVISTQQDYPSINYVGEDRGSHSHAVSKQSNVYEDEDDVALIHQHHDN